MHKFNFINVNKETTAFLLPIFMQLTNAKCHCVQVSLYWIKPISGSRCGKYG